MVFGVGSKVLPIAEDTVVEDGLEDLDALRSGGSHACSGNARDKERIMCTTPDSAASSFRFAPALHSQDSHGNVAHGDVVSRVKSATMMRKASSIQGGSRQGDVSARNGALASRFQVPHPTPGRGLCFSPDGTLLLRFGYSSELRIINAVDGKPMRTLRNSQGNIRFASFSKNSRHIVASSDDCHVYIYEVQKVLKGVTSPEADIDVGDEPVAFCLLSPDGQVVLSCDDDGQLETWSVEDERMLQRYEPGHLSVVAAFASHGKQIISCANLECGLVLVDVATAEVVTTETFDELHEGRNKPAYCIASDGSKAILYIKEQTFGDNVAVYDVETMSYTTLRACDGAVMHVVFSPSGTDFLVAGRDNMIHVYDAETLDMLGILSAHAADVLYCAVSRDQVHAISGDSDGTVYTWNISNCQPLLQLQAHKAPVVACDVNRDGSRAYTLDAQGVAHLWYMDQQGIFDVLQQNSDILSCCQLSKDAKHCCVGYSDGTVRLFTLGIESSMVWQHSRHGCPVEAMAFNPVSGAIVTAGRDGRMLLSGIANGEMLATVTAHADTITWLSYNEDGSKLLSCARNGTLCLWEGSEGQWASGPSRTFQIQGDGINNVLRCALDPRGSVAVAACLSGMVHMWDTGTGYLTQSVHVSEVEARALAFSDDGRCLLVGCGDGRTLVLEADTGKRLRTIVANASAITSVYFDGKAHEGKHISELRAVSVCSRQAVTLDLSGSSSTEQVADFLSDPNTVFRNTVMEDREVVAAEHGILLYDPSISAAMYDMRVYEVNPGNSALFRDGTCVVSGGVHGCKLVMYSPPDKTVTMLVTETGGIKCVDFSPDGKLLVAGNLRGELSIWDTVHKQQIKSWVAHKRSAITCVKFSQDVKQVYSCGEDTKVILWDWRTGTQSGTLVGHQAAVVSVEMSLNGARMVSGDKDGIVIIWDTAKQDASHVVAAHDGPILCCSMCPDGSRVISSGQDEHICIIDCNTGEELYNLDDSLDGKGLTVKFSFDGTRVQIGGEKGNILIWSMEKNCLLYDIEAHSGRVYDCSWSGDSRRLLSVGTDGKARLWDAAAGSELCQANFEHGFGVVDSGGFVKCDLSADGTIMSGCTAKGHLIQWDTGIELRKSPNGQFLYKCLANMPLAKARQVYRKLLRTTPLLFNAQDSRGWTVLMHAAANSNPEIIKLIVGCIQPKQGCLGLMASALQKLAGYSGMGSDAAVERREAQDATDRATQPNAITIAIAASTGDSVNHLLNAVLDEKVTPGSYAAVTDILPEVTQQYPSMCEMFLSRLPLKVLGEIEIPSYIAAQGVVVKAATSYTSYKELWEKTLKLDEAKKGPMVLMEAVMVRLPFCALTGHGSILDTLVESSIPVNTFGSETVHAIITYKWRKFAQFQIYTKALMYITFVLLFTAYAIVLSDDPGPPVTYLNPLAVNANLSSTNITTTVTCTLLVGNTFTCVNSTQLPDGSLSGDPIPSTVSMGVDLKGLASYPEGRLEIALSLMVFLFGVYFMALEALQLFKLGAAAYFDSFWNFVDLAGYGVAIILAPCVLSRYGMQDRGFVYALVALECILLWTKAMFFGMAVDGLGTFIYILFEILKGLKFFYVLMICLYISFGASFMNLFRLPLDPNDIPTDTQTTLFTRYGNFQRALLSSFMAMFGLAQDARDVLYTMWPEIGVIVLCIYNFLLIVILLNMIVTLMSDLMQGIKAQQQVVFLRNRAELIMEVESTMSAVEVRRVGNCPPYLHLLRPLNLEDKRNGDDGDYSSPGGDGTRLSEAGLQPLSRAGSKGSDSGIPPLKPAPSRCGVSARFDPDGRDSAGAATASRRELLRAGSSVASRATTRAEPVEVKERPTRGHRISNAASRLPSTSLDVDGASPAPHPLEKLLLDMSKDMESMRRMVETLSRGRSASIVITPGAPVPPGCNLSEGQVRRHSRRSSKPTHALIVTPPHSPGSISSLNTAGSLHNASSLSEAQPAALPSSPGSDVATDANGEIGVDRRKSVDDSTTLTHALHKLAGSHLRTTHSPHSSPASTSPVKAPDGGLDEEPADAAAFAVSTAAELELPPMPGVASGPPSPHPWLPTAATGTPHTNDDVLQL